MHLVRETESIPAVIVGTSSDRIGTPTGTGYYINASKSLKREIGLPIAPYIGGFYGTFEDKTRLVGGLSIRYSESFSSLHMYDGVNVHHMLSWNLNEQTTLGLLLIDNRTFGISLGISF